MTTWAVQFPKSNQLIRTVLLSVSLLVLAGSCYGVERLLIETGSNPDYLPYYLDSVHSYRYLSSVKLSPTTAVRPFRITEADGHTRIFVAQVQTPLQGSSDRPRFSIRDYPSWSLREMGEHPVDFDICGWATHFDSSLGVMSIIAGGPSNDGVILHRLFPGTDAAAPQQVKLVSRPDSIPMEEWNPWVTLPWIGRLYSTGAEKALVFVDHKKVHRRLYCVDISTMSVDWQLDVSSPIIWLSVFPHAIDPRITLCTNNPSNGVKDKNFDDRFAYLVTLDGEGNILNKKIISDIFGHQPRLTRHPTEERLFLTHDLYADDTTEIIDSKPSEYSLSIIDPIGNIMKSAPLTDHPAQMAIIPYGPDGKDHLWLSNYDGTVALYTTELGLIAVSDTVNMLYYLMDIKLSWITKPVHVFNDGLYDYTFTKLLQFPIYATTAEPIGFDPEGNVTDLALNTHGTFYLGAIKKRSTIALASAFYHNNQVYVLMILSGLLVGLVLTNSFRKRSKKNLGLIAKQKSELERTHTELIETQDALVAAEKYKQAKDIAGGFAHEIRNALFPADGLLTKVQRKDPKDIETERLKKYHKTIHSAVSRAVGITELISQYTKLDSEYLPEETNIASVILEIIRANQFRIEQQKVTVNLPKVDSTIVRANRKQIEIVVSNLLLNSLDALKDRSKPVIDIVLSVTDNRLLMEFSDNGTGIETDKLDKIFDTFYSTKPETGIGIGLSMVKKIVEMYEGQITVGSVLGQGTKFDITFPSVEINTK